MRLEGTWQRKLRIWSSSIKKIKKIKSKIWHLVFLSRKINNISPLDEEVIWNYLIQIAQGLKYLHDKRVLHRDIKPGNIFLDQHDNIKIGDMGLGRVLGPQVMRRVRK